MEKKNRHKKELEKKQEKVDRKSIDAYKYATDFEKISLEIVKIVSNQFFDINYIEYADTTQATRDLGVDAYLIIKINGAYSTYTVEAKLRTTKTLSLKDFATSILYYLINASSKHFIVTNVTYSSEAQKYIRQLNANNNKLVELIDGKFLQEIIIHNQKTFKDYPTELITYLCSETYDSTNVLEINVYAERMENNTIPLSFFETISEDVDCRSLYQTNVFIVTGMSRTGKSSWIEYYIHCRFPNHTVYKLDFIIIQTPRLLVFELLHLLLGFDIGKLVNEVEKTEHYLIEYLKEKQKFHNKTDEVVEALKILLEENAYSTETYTYMMRVLIEYLYKNFLVHSNIVLIMDNLWEASLEMIDFTINTMYCLGKENIIIFWEILTPCRADQLPNITIEQWYVFLQALEHHKCQKNNTVCRVEMPGLSEENIIEVIEKFIPDIVFTDEFKQVFIEYFGANISTVFEALRYIKYQKSYSSVSLGEIHLNFPILIENQINNLISNTSDMRLFYHYVFQFCLLLEGKLYAPVIRYLDNKFEVNTVVLLIQSGLFFIKEKTLIFSYQKYLDHFEMFINNDVKNTCIRWLKKNLSKLNFDALRSEYLDIFCSTLIEPEKAIAEINEKIKYLYQNQMFKYVLFLAEFRYNYYKNIKDELNYYEYFVEYISYMRRIPSKQRQAMLKLSEALRVRENLFCKYQNNKRYIETGLKLDLIQYHIAKSNYEYHNCEKFLQNILRCEKEDNEIFILARIYYALNKKEYGNRKEFIMELVNNYKKYPYDMDVKLSYYINLAAMYKFNNIDLAIKLLKIAQRISFKNKLGVGDLEVETNLLHMLCYKGVLSYGQIMNIRLMSEKISSTNNLAKTFNLEAYYYIKNALFQNKFSSIEECIRTAIFYSCSNGNSKQSFLFRLNLVTILLAEKVDSVREFNTVIDWFIKNQSFILKRLQKNIYRNNDHMFVALISLICSSKKLKQNLLYNTQIFEVFPQLENLSYKELLNQVPDYYKIKYINNILEKETIIFILF